MAVGGPGMGSACVIRRTHVGCRRRQISIVSHPDLRNYVNRSGGLVVPGILLRDEWRGGA